LVVFVWLTTSHATETVASGSACVAIRTPTEVIVGTDSKRTFNDTNKAPDSICKIHRFGDTFFTSTGLYRSGTNLDVLALAKAACSGDDSLSNKVARFETQVRDKLTRAMVVIQREQPAEYKATFLGRRVIDAAFWAVEKRQPVLRTMMFTIGDSSNRSPVVKVERKLCPGDCPGGEGVIYLGHSDAIESYVAKHPKLFDGDLARAIETLINVQAAATPETVGGEVDIVRLTNDGAKWVQRKEDCPEVASESAVQPAAKVRQP
jgi:hypothetical protein